MGIEMGNLVTDLFIIPVTTRGIHHYGLLAGAVPTYVVPVHHE